MQDKLQPKTERLDQYVTRNMPDVSRGYANKLIETKAVLVNGEGSKPSYRLKSGDKVIIHYQGVSSAQMPEINLPIIYEDEDCVVINKPVGVLVHSKGDHNPEATVATWLSKYTTGMGGNRGGIVHRLDRATSGVMICAKNPEALGWLQKQFSQRKTKKTYIAVVEGRLAQEAAIIDMPIERNPKKPQTFRVGINGRTAQTEYKVIGTNDKYSLLQINPTTGRTHQLRVHLKHLGHPILGDTLYGGRVAERLFLHALILEITLPNRKREIFETKLPKEFNAIMKP